MCRQNIESDKTEVKHIDMEEESQDCPRVSTQLHFMTQMTEQKHL